MDEQEAIARLKRGEIGGLEVLVLRHQTQALHSAYLVCRDRQLAEDIVQAAFLRVYERAAQFDSRRPFAPWFLRIVVNDALKAATRGQRQISLSADAATVLIERSGDVEQVVELAIAHKEIAAALNQLSARQRAAIVLRYYLDQSEVQMAAQLKIEPGAVKRRLQVARQRLRQLLPAWLHPAAAPLEGDDSGVKEGLK